MKITVTKKVDLEGKYLYVKAGVRYWEDGTVNDEEDLDGELIPCRKGDYWCPIIDIDAGIITNWEKGKKASIHYKVCDDGVYTIKDIDQNVIVELDGYVPNIMCPEDDGYGDYIIMEITEDGYIKNWEPDFKDFIEQED